MVLVCYDDIKAEDVYGGKKQGKRKMAMRLKEEEGI